VAPEVFARDLWFALLRVPVRNRKPVPAPLKADREQLRAALQRIPHPPALRPLSLLCACGLSVGSEVHDSASLLNTRAFLNGRGGARERAARELAARELMVQSRTAEEAVPLKEAAKEPAAGEGAPLPEGVLGYAVGVFPEDGSACSGLTHTGRMSLDAARREASAYAAAARTEQFSAFHGRCGYRAVEIREVGNG
jgi:ribosomal protein S11